MRKSPYLHRKTRRKIFGPIAEPMGFIFSHELKARDSQFLKEGIEPYRPTFIIRFYWLKGYIELHNNTDTIINSFSTYVRKIDRINEMIQKAYDHILSGSGPLIVRDFLNEVEINDGFGGTLFIHTDPDDCHNYCIFEISSCYKKYRHTGNVTEIKKYLRNLLDFLSLVKKDLTIIENKIKTLNLKGKESGN